MLKKWITTLLVVFGLLTPIQAELHYNLEDFESTGIHGQLDVAKVNENTFIKTGLSPDFKLGSVEIGMDINIYLPLNKESDYPSNLEFLTLRRVAYNYNDLHGFKWGRLKNVTIGMGLLMNNYDTGSAGSNQFSTKKAGLHAYTTLKNIRGEVLWTPQQVQAGRLQYTFEESPFFGSPIAVGASYVTDQDGENENWGKETIIRQKQDGLGVDISAPIGGDFFTPYVEYAELTNLSKGKGGSAGIKGRFFDQLSYRMEYRKLGTGFVPGYFGSTYHSSSFDFATQAPKKEINGFLGSVSSSLLNNYIKAGLVYEKYDTKDLLTASLGWKQLGNTVGVVNYRAPFQGKDNATLRADILFLTGKGLDYVVHFKRTYLGNDTFTESYEVGLRYNFDSFFSSFLKK